MQLYGPRLWPLLVGTLFVALFSSAPGARAHAIAQEPRREVQQEVASLRDALLGLSTAVSPRDAARTAARAHETAGNLKREYRVLGPPQFHNFLVNAGVRKRGLCHQWTRDLMAQLSALNPKTLDLHWGTARAGTLREHNTVVVTAKRQPFADGIVLDPWRHSGRLFVGRVADDRYPWDEDLRDCLCERRRRHNSNTARARMTSSGALRDLAAKAARSADPTR